MATRRELLGGIAEQTSGELRSLLDDQLLSQPGFDEAMLDGWEEDRARLVEAHDDAWLSTVLGEGITREDGEQIRTSDFFFYKDMAYERLVIGCRAPELVDGPAQETSEDPAAGRLVFYRPDDRHDFGDGGRLVATIRRVVTSGTWRPWHRGNRWDGSTLSPPATTASLSALDRAMTSPRWSSPRAARCSTPQRASGQLICPAWNADGNQVLGLSDTSDADERRLHLVDLTGSSPSRPLPLPFAAVGCGDFISDDRLVVSDATLAPATTAACGPSMSMGPIPASSMDPRAAQLPWAASIRPLGAAVRPSPELPGASRPGPGEDAEAPHGKSSTEPSWSTKQPCSNACW